MVIIKLEEQPQLIQAIFCGELEDVKTVLEVKPDVNYQDCEKRSPLHAAAYRGDKELAQLLIAQGARVNTKDSKWYTPLHRACGVGSEDTVELLLKHNADTCARDRQWQTPLHIAAANNAIECVSHLLNNIPNVNVTDRAGRTALHHASLNGHSDVVELLISRGCIVNACDKKDCRPIHCASHMGHVDTLEQLLHNGADVNVKDRNQYTPLHAAAASGMVYACRLLLNSGADVNVQNAYGNTPLHIACLNGHLNICTELISFNADFEMVNYKGQTPVHIAATSTHGMPCLQSLMENNANINRHSLDGRTALHMSAVHGRFTRSKALIDSGAIIDAMDKNGATALHVAAQYGHDILSATLLSHGADPSKRGYQGRTPLHITCLSGFVECCRKFTQVINDINIRDDTGKTPIHCAAYRGSVECLDLLVSQGGDFKLEDYFGGTALHYAASRGHYNCVFTLVGIGTPVNVVDQEGCTALHLAAAFDHEGRCVQYLLQHKADPKLKDRHGFTPIHYAVSNSNSNALEFLLEAVGTNYTLYGPDMPLTTPLHIAAKCGDMKILKLVIPYFPDTNIRDANGATALLLAAREGHTHSVQMLLRYGAKVAICEEKYQMSPVHYSAKNGHMHCLALLVDNAEDKSIIDRPDRLYRTALMLAVSGCHRDCVLTLLKSNCDPNIVDSDKHSSLFRAVVTGQNNVAQLLITKGALVTPADSSGKTVLHLAAAFGQFSCLQTVLNHTTLEEAAICDNEQFNALHWACYNGNATCLEYLLSKDAFKEIDGNIFSPVHCASFAGSERCLELLYNRYGAQIVKLTDARKRTPLHIAALHGHIECARYLLEQGAEINIKDELGRTALIAAAQNGQSQIIDLLVGHKADVTQVDVNGNTALHLACLKRHNHTALLILEYINDVDIINMSNNDRKTSLHLAARNGLVDVTRDLIKKGSSVLAVDSNGLTPALCCAPNTSVAQCLAIILANHPVQFPNDNKSSKDASEILETLFLVSKPLSHKISTQTEISLLRDPREIFQDMAQRVKPKLKSNPTKTHSNHAHRRPLRPTLHNNIPNWHKMPPLAVPKTGGKPTVKRANSAGIIFIEAYDKKDCLEAKPIEDHCGLGLHRSISDIALAPNDGQIGDIPIEAVHKESVDKLINGYKSVAKKMTELTKMYDVSFEDINRIYMNHCNETHGVSDAKRAEIVAQVSAKMFSDRVTADKLAQPCTSNETAKSRSLIKNRHVEKYEDVFKTVLGQRTKEFLIHHDENVEPRANLHSGGDSDVPTTSFAVAAVEKQTSKRRCCEFVCAKCVNTNMFDPRDDDIIAGPIAEDSDYHDCLDDDTFAIRSSVNASPAEMKPKSVDINTSTSDEEINITAANTIYCGSIKDIRLGAISKTRSIPVNDETKSSPEAMSRISENSRKNFEGATQESDDDFEENRPELRIVELDVYASDDEETEIDSRLYNDNYYDCYGRATNSQSCGTSANIVQDTCLSFLGISKNNENYDDDKKNAGRCPPANCRKALAANGEVVVANCDEANSCEVSSANVDGCKAAAVGGFDGCEAMAADGCKAMAMGSCETIVAAGLVANIDKSLVHDANSNETIIFSDNIDNNVLDFNENIAGVVDENGWAKINTEYEKILPDENVNDLQYANIDKLEVRHMGKDGDGVEVEIFRRRNEIGVFLTDFSMTAENEPLNIVPSKYVTEKIGKCDSLIESEALEIKNANSIGNEAELQLIEDMNGNTPSKENGILYTEDVNEYLTGENVRKVCENKQDTQTGANLRKGCENKQDGETGSNLRKGCENKQDAQTGSNLRKGCENKQDAQTGANLRKGCENNQDNQKASDEKLLSLEQEAYNAYRYENGIDFDSDIEIFDSQSSEQLERMFSTTDLDAGDNDVEEFFGCDNDEFDAEILAGSKSCAKDSKETISLVVDGVQSEIHNNQFQPQTDVQMSEYSNKLTTTCKIDPDHEVNMQEHSEVSPTILDGNLTQSSEVQQKLFGTAQNLNENVLGRGETNQLKPEESFSTDELVCARENSSFVQKALKSVYKKTRSVSKTAIVGAETAEESSTPKIERYVYQTLENAYRSDINVNKLEIEQDEEAIDGDLAEMQLTNGKFEHQTLGNAYRLEMELNAAENSVCRECAELENKARLSKNSITDSSKISTEDTPCHLHKTRANPLEIERSLCEPDLAENETLLSITDDFERVLNVLETEAQPSEHSMVTIERLSIENLSDEDGLESSVSGCIVQDKNIFNEEPYMRIPVSLEELQNIKSVVICNEMPKDTVECENIDTFIQNPILTLNDRSNDPGLVKKHQTILTNSEIFELRQEAITSDEIKTLKINDLEGKGLDEIAFYSNSFLTQSECQLNENYQLYDTDAANDTIDGCKVIEIESEEIKHFKPKESITNHCCESLGPQKNSKLYNSDQLKTNGELQSGFANLELRTSNQNSLIGQKVISKEITGNNQIQTKKKSIANNLKQSETNQDPKPVNQLEKSAESLKSDQCKATGNCKLAKTKVVRNNQFKKTSNGKPINEAVIKRLKTNESIIGGIKLLETNANLKKDNLKIKTKSRISKPSSSNAVLEKTRVVNSVVGSKIVVDDASAVKKKALIGDVAGQIEADTSSADKKNGVPVGVDCVAADNLFEGDATGDEDALKMRKNVGKKRVRRADDATRCVIS